MGGGMDTQSLKTLDTELLELHQANFLVEAEHMIDGLLDGRVTPEAWGNFLRGELTSLYISAALIGAGDPKVVKGAVFPDIQKQLTVQEPYIHRFVAQLSQPERNYSKKALLARTSLYAHSADEWVERGFFKAQRLPDLPFYPKAWTECRHHCHCTWRFERVSGRPNDYEVYWVLDPEVEHCRTCQNRARYCNPLHIRNGVWTNNLPYQLLFANL